MAPLVTVLMSVYNGERYLRASVESVLAQTFSDFELIIVNDGSTDSSRAIITSYQDPRILLVESEGNVGQPAALNLGLRRARGEWVARQDADDICLPCRLEEQLRFLHAHPELVMLGAQAWLMDADGQPLGVTYYPCHDSISLRWLLCFENPFVHSTLMFRRSIILDEFGGYDETIRYGEDFALCSRLVSRHPAALMSQPVIRYRLHAGSKTATQRGLGRENYASVIAANVRAALPDLTCSAEEWDLLTGWREDMNAAQWKSYLALMERLSGLYQARYPEVGVSTAFRRTLGFQYGHYGRQLLLKGDLAGVRTLAQGILRTPIGPVLVLWRWFLQGVAAVRGAIRRQVKAGR